MKLLIIRSKESVLSKNSQKMFNSIKEECKKMDVLPVDCRCYDAMDLKELDLSKTPFVVLPPHSFVPEVMESLNANKMNIAPNLLEDSCFELIKKIDYYRSASSDVLILGCSGSGLHLLETAAQHNYPVSYCDIELMGKSALANHMISSDVIVLLYDFLKPNVTFSTLIHNKELIDAMNSSGYYESGKCFGKEQVYETASRILIKNLKGMF